MMSDPEAGESEGPENPEPEDDADLSTFSSDAAATPTLPAPSPPAASSQQRSDTAGDESSAPAQTVDEAENGSAHPEPAACHGEHENHAEAPAQAVSGCGDGPEEDRREELTQQAWSAESDRSSRNHQNGDSNVSGVSAEGDVDDVHRQSECEEDSRGDVEQAINSSVMQQSEDSGEVSASVGTDRWDQEESPPEDELFAQHTSTAGAESAEGDAGTTRTESDSSEGAGCEEVSPVVASTQAHSSPLLRQPGADGDTDRTQQEASSLSASQSAPCDPAALVPTGPAADKEDDQVPECDREPTQHSSPPGDHPNSQEAVSSDQAHSSQSSVSVSSAPTEDTEDRSRLNDAHTQDAEDRSRPGTVHSEDSENRSGAMHIEGTDSKPCSSPASQSSTKAPSPSVNKQAESVTCDHSSDCDSALTQHSNISPLSQQSRSRSDLPVAVSLSEDRKMIVKPSFLDDDSEEEELLTELDAELQLKCSPRRQQSGFQGGCVRLPLNGLKELEGMNTELCKQFEEQLLQLQEVVLQREREVSRLKDVNSRQREVSQEVIAERDRLKAELSVVKDKNPDDLYLPQIKELEYTISQQQGEVRQLKEKLTTHDAAAKRAIATLQSEMKARIDQITKLYEDCSREKDAMVVKFAEAETKNIEAKCSEEKMEARVRDLLKEKEFTNNKMRAAMAEKQKAVSDLKTKVGEMAVLQKEVEKLREDMSSTDYRIKWHQNKLKAELDAHRETKTNLEKTTAKLKEAKEETEMIRRDCQAIVKTYQESEEVRSNSLDKELKMKQTELMIKMKEHSDTEEIHLKTKQELEALKAHHKDAMEELKTLKDKVQCLEEERLQGEQVQAKYQTIIQNQKSDNTSLSKQLNSLQTLQEDFDRAQEMIKSLDHEVGELKLANRDLQKDIDSCQARESKMLTLQSELSRTNALLRSENTTLNNQVATLSGEVQKMSMDIQDLETRCRNMMDQLEEEQTKRQEETSTLSSQLAVKTKESDDYRQKWEDEIDASKTWKRKHNNNVKDLTRQLQHAKKRLESYESGGGGGERDATSMGSRTNSNGSLNSMDNSNQHNHHPHPAPHPPHPAPRPPSQEPEFPVITEQVEVDRQLLIERIVKLQRSLARKNEKLDFVEEHIQQLVSEIKKKNRIIQGYVMREEAGTLASDVMDANKALLARKGGIMASVYSHHQQDGAMTLDLSLEINQKLQAVLEDTLLKNITLKENLDTLGAEIARLSQENRRLQLHLQGLDTH